jgi:hypothetical protein
MSRRIDIEITSLRSDGSWTWRAAGALQPKGVADAIPLPSDTKPGSVLRAEVDTDLDGVWIRQLLPVKTSSPKPATLEMAAKQQDGGVTVQLAPKGRDKARPRRSTDERRSSADSSGPGKTSGRPPRNVSSRESASDKPRRRPPRETELRSASTDAQSIDEEKSVRQKEKGASRKAPHTPRQKAVRLNPQHKHLDALYQKLSAEEIPVAEKLAAGGMPNLRRALQQEKDLAKQEGRLGLSEDAILQIAERIHSDVKEAVWRDRADAAILILDHISLHDLRAVVSQAVPRDDEGHELLQRLRTSLSERLEKLRNKWEADIAHSLDTNKTLQALRLSAKPPEPTAKLTAALATRLAENVSAAMTSDISPERWIALVEAAASSPIKRLVKPIGIPDHVEVKKEAVKELGRIPSLAHLLGVAMPPPPGPPSVHHNDHHQKSENTNGALQGTKASQNTVEAEKEVTENSTGIPE